MSDSLAGIRIVLIDDSNTIRRSGEIFLSQAGAKVVQVNPTATALDDDCTWALRGAAGVLLPQVLKDLTQRK